MNQPHPSRRAVPSQTPKSVIEEKRKLAIRKLPNAGECENKESILSPIKQTSFSISASSD